MDWNLKTITQWDWESLALNFNGKESDGPHSEQESQLRVEGDGSISNGSVYSSEAGAHSGCEFGNGCSPKSSISASTDSSSMTQIKISEFDFQAAHLSFQKPSMKKEFARVTANDTSPVVVSTAGHGEHMIGLKLGKRTYFEDVCHGSNIFSSSSSSSSSFSSSSSLTSVISSVTLSKKSKVSLRSASFCQVEGCNIDLSAAKEYHRKHRVCESHSKCPKVIVDGQERRFCQQCSRFHELSEFDQKKRSCRRRLSDHNARRRKPQSDFISFNSGRFTPFYDDRHHTNLILNKACPTMNSMSDASWDFNLMQTKGSWIKSTKTGAFNGGQQFPSFTLQNTSSTLSNDIDRVLSFKDSPAEAFNQGLEALDVASNLDGAPELRRAFSLLSTNSWNTYERSTNSLASLANKNTAAAADLPAIQTLSNTTKLWQDEVPLIQQAVMTPLFNLQRNSSQFQLVRASYDSETAFCDSSQIY